MRSPTPVIPIVPAETSLYAKTPKVYPRAVSGHFARWRWAMVALTQAVFYGLPWMHWNGRPLMLFDLEARRFHVLGLILYPQDFIYLTALLVMSALALFFFTAVAGRLWCGYACPQTVYTELFLWIEHHTEGDRSARMRLDRQPWGWDKLWRKSAKHAGWGALALFTGFSFVAYFTPAPVLARELWQFSASPWEAFWVLFYAGATYGNAGWMREQVCKYMCPYARFQSALIDGDSLVIAYDTRRGDPRGARKGRHEAGAPAAARGDCIDCSLCVQVCPTGIDIRNGLQNECIGCAACIDACDDVMDRVGSPRGLIRYATGHGMAQGLGRAQMLRRVLRPRVLVYGALLAAGGVAFVASIALRSPLHLDVLKDRNTLGRVLEDGRIENVYRLHLLNATAEPQRVQVSARGLPGLALAQPTVVSLEAAETGAATVQLVMPADAPEALRGHAEPVEFELRGEHGLVVRAKSTFFVPR